MLKEFFFLPELLLSWKCDTYSCASISWILPSSGWREHNSDEDVTKALLEKCARYGGFSVGRGCGRLNDVTTIEPKSTFLQKKHKSVTNTG